MADRTTPPYQWPAEAIWEAVSGTYPNFSVEVLPQLDSTNSELMRRARSGQLEPVLLVAEHQTAGRGRMGRDWVGAQTHGALTALTFSLGLVLQPRDWSGLSLAVGLSLVGSLHPALQLKWPNDILWQGRKLGGILIETASVGDARYAVIGIGINLVAPAADGLRTPPAGLQELLPDMDAAALLGRIAAPLVRNLARFEQQGFAPLREDFNTRDALRDQEVQCSDGLTGTARGVDSVGALLVHTAQGLKKITSAEVSVRVAADPLSS